ncbi:MAG: hypothetical protein U1F67_22135 [Rubrivivax sp.]
MKRQEACEHARQQEPDQVAAPAFDDDARFERPLDHHQQVIAALGATL